MHFRQLILTTKDWSLPRASGRSSPTPACDSPPPATCESRLCLPVGRYDRVTSSVGARERTGSMAESHPSDSYIHGTMDPHAATGRSITVESQRKGPKYNIFETANC